MISSEKQKEMQESRIALRKIFETVNVLARQGIALRGDNNDEGSNLMQFLQMRAKDVPELNAWLKRDSCKWLHHDIINEILQMMSNEVLRSIIRSTIQSAQYFAIIADETADISKSEQVSICIRTVRPDLTIEESFLGFYETSDTKAKTLFQIILDVLARFGLDIANLRGQCYDGAKNMSGILAGLQTLMRNVEPRAVYIHCRPHTLNLVVQDALEKVAFVKNFIGMVKEIINFIRDSPKRLAEFKDLQSDNSPNLSQFCPTR